LTKQPKTETIFGDEWVLEHHSNFNVDEILNKEVADET
jgi:hypothetical protein